VRQRNTENGRCTTQVLKMMVYGGVICAGSRRNGRAQKPKKMVLGSVRVLMEHLGTRFRATSHDAFMQQDLDDWLLHDTENWPCRVGWA
jgi:hypothetical protein